MKPLFPIVVAIIVLAANAHPENIEEVKQLPQNLEPVLEAEETEPQERVERCTTCSPGLKINLKAPKDVLAALQQLPAGEVHTQQSFEGCSSDKGCAGLKVKDGQVIQRFGNVDAFQAAAAQDTGNEFTFHAAGSLGNLLEGGLNGEGSPFWWMNQNSPFKNTAGGNYEKFSKSSSSSFSTGGAGGVGVDLAANPFLNGDFSKLAGGFTSGGAGFSSSGASNVQATKPNYQSSSFESSSFSSSSKGDVDLSKNPFLNGAVNKFEQSGFQAEGGFNAGQIGANAAQFGASAGQSGFGAQSNFNQFGASKFGAGYTGSSPSPFTASTAGSNVNLIQNSQKASEFDFEQQQSQQSIDEAFQSTGNVNAHEHSGGDLQQVCAGQGYVCVHKAQCNNGVVNTNGGTLLQANTQKQYCNIRTEICCRIETSSLAGAGSLQGSLGVGSATFTGSGSQGNGLFATNTQNSQSSSSFNQNSGSFGQNSGSGGQNSGSFGQNSGAFGQNSGSASQNSASFGQNTGSLDQSSSSFGQRGQSGFSSQASFNQNGQSSFGQNGQSGLNQNGQSGFTQNGQSGLNQNGQSGFSQNGQSGLSQNGQSGFSQNGQSGFNQNGQSGFSQNGQSGFNQNGQSSSTTGFGASFNKATSSFGSQGFGSGVNSIGVDSNRGVALDSSSSFEATKGNRFGGFGSTVAPVNKYGGSSFQSTSQSNFIETDSFSAGSEQAGIYRPGAVGSPGLKPGIPYLPPLDSSTSASNVVSSTAFTTQRPRPVTTVRPFTTPRPVVPSTSAPGYLPPEGESSNNRETRLPPNPNYSDGSLILDQNRQPTSPPIRFTPGPAPNEIPSGCAAALKCTPIEYCTAEGVISNTTVVLTRDQDAYRVPLTDCKDVASGRVGKCCRDPFYTDPWPTNQLGRWVPGVFGGNDGRYVPDSRGSPSTNVRPQVTARPPVTGSIYLNNIRTTKPTAGPTFGPNQLLPGFPTSTPGSFIQKGQFDTRDQGSYSTGGRGQVGIGSQGQFGVSGLGQTSQGSQYGQGSQFSQTTSSFGQVTKGGQGQIVSQKGGQGVIQGQGSYAQGGRGQYEVQGQAGQNQYTQTQGISQGQGFGVIGGSGQTVSQGVGQLVTQGQGVGVIRGSGQSVIEGQGQSFSQGAGIGVTQNQGLGITQGQGQLVTQGQGQLVSQGQGQLVSQGQGSGFSRGQGQVVLTGQGIGATQGSGQRVSQSNGFEVSQGFGTGILQGQGFGVSRGQGQASQNGGFGVLQGSGFGVNEGQGQAVSQGAGFEVRQGSGQSSSQGIGFGISQGTGQGVAQGASFGIQQGQGGFGIRTEGGGFGLGLNQGVGFGLSRGEGQTVIGGQGQKLTQGIGSGEIRGEGFQLTQGGGIGVENEYSESVQRVFLSKYNGEGQCGQLNPEKPYGNRADLEVDFAEIPWQAMVLLQTNRSLLCGGVITRPDVVVTSAACVDGLDAKNVLIKGGEWKLGIDDEPLPFQIVQVKNILRHPFYRRGSLKYDAAILVLAENLRFAQNIYPICLPGASDTLDGFYNGAGECMVTGWGKIVLQAHLKGSIMHSLNVSLINPGECEAKLQSDYPHLLEQYDADSCVCGQPTNPLNNICKVDIGSALACTTGDGHFVFRGIYSWDSGCQVGNQIAGFYKFDLEWYQWAIGLIESVRFTKYTSSSGSNFSGQINSGIKTGIKGSLSGVKGISGSNQFGLGQFSQFGASKYSEGTSGLISSEIKPVSNSFSATYTEKKVFQTEPKYVTYTTKPEIVTFTTKPEYFTYTTKPKIVTYTTKPEIVTYTTKPKIVTYTTKPQIIRYETSGSGTNPQYVAPGVTFNPSFTDVIGHKHDGQCKCLEGKK